MKANFYLFAKVVAVVFVVAVLFSCAPMSKDSYLESYKEFVDEVGDNYKNYTTDDWKAKDAKYEKYVGEWYDKYKDEMTFKETLSVGGYSTKYNAYKAKVVMGEFIDSCEEYIENDMEEDLNTLYEKSKEFTEELQKEVENFVSDFESEY